MHIKVENKVPKSKRPVKVETPVVVQTPTAEDIAKKEALIAQINAAKTVADLKDILTVIVTGKAAVPKK